MNNYSYYRRKLGRKMFPGWPTAIMAVLLEVSANSIPGQTVWTNANATSASGLLNWGAPNNWVPNQIPNAVDSIAIFTNSPNLTINSGQTYTNGTISCTSGSGWIVKYGSGTNYLEVSSGLPILNVSPSGATSWFQGAYLGGTQGFLKTGAGKLTFRYDNNINPISGPIVIGTGTLGFQVDGNLGNASNGLILSNNTVLTCESANASPQSVTLAPTRTITLAGTQEQIGVLGSTFTLVVPCLINESIAGSGLLWSSSGELVLSNANTFTGPMTMTAGTNDLANANAVEYGTMTVNGGTLLFDQSVSSNFFRFGGLAGSASGTSVALQNNAATPAPITLAVGGNNASTSFAGALTGAGSLIKTGTGTLTLSGNNTYSNATTIGAGTLALGSSGSINNSASITIAAGATYDVSAINTYALSSSTSLTANGTASAATIKGAIGGTVNLGSQAITLNYNGTNPALVIPQGTLALSGQTITVNTASALTNGIYNIISQSSGSISASGSFVLAGTAGTGTIAINGGNVQLIITPAPSSTNTWTGAAGDNNWGTANNWSPATVPNAAGAIVNFTNVVGPTVTNTYNFGTLNFSAGTSTMNGAGTLVAQVSAGTPVINIGSGANLYFYTTLNGNQGYTKTGAGTLTFRYSTTVQPISGPINIVAGTLGIQDDFSLGNTNNDIVIAGGATLLEQNSANSGSYTLSPGRTIILGGAAAQIAVATGESLTIPGNIQDNPAGQTLVVNSSGGTLVLAGTNTYSGGTTVSAGTLSISSSNNVGAAGTPLTFNGGALQITGTNLTSLADSGHAVVFNPGQNVILDINAPGNMFLADSILNQGSGGLTKLGTGTLKLTLTNSYSGGTTISAGTLALGSTGSLNNTPSISIAAGATYDVSAVNPYTLSSSNTLIANGNATNAILAGAAGGVVSLGSRPVTLNYDGTDPALVVSQGTLSLTGQTFTVNCSVPLGNGTNNLIQVNSGNINHSGSFSVTGTATNSTAGGMIVFSTNAGIAYVQMVISGSNNGGTVTTTLLSSNETDYGTVSVMKATVTPGNVPGAVQFYVDGVAFGSPVTLAGGSATIPSTLGLAYGTHTVTASYLGYGSYSASSSGPVTLTLVNVAVASNEADAFELWLLHNQNQFPNDFYLAAPSADSNITSYVANLTTNGMFLDISNYPPANSGYVLTENGSQTGWLTHLPRLTAIYAALINTNSTFYIVNNPALITNLMPRLITATLAYTHVPWDITDQWGYCHTWADLCEGYALGSVCLYSRQVNRLVPGLVPVNDIDAWGNRIPDQWRNGHIDTTYMTPANGSISTEDLQFQVTGGNMVWTSQGIILKYLTQSTNAVRLEGLDASFQHFWHGCSLIGAKHEEPPGWAAYTALPQMSVDYMLGEHDTPYLLIYGGSYINGMVACRNDMVNYPRWALPAAYGINQLFANCIIQGVAPLSQGYPDRILASRGLTSSAEYSPTFNLNSWINDFIGFGYRTNELQELLTWNHNNNPGTNNWPFTNNTFTHFYTSDYSCQHYPNYLVTFRGISERTCGIENLQNPLAGYFPQGRQIFVPLGGSYIYANGNEYGQVSYNATGAVPFESSCDYTRIPGVTAKAMPDSAFTNYWRYVYGNLPFAGTAAANNSGVSGWEQSRYVRTDQWTNAISLSGNSAVFYLDMAVVHLGAGFDNSQDAYPTTTSLNQCLSATNIITYGLTDGTTQTIPSTGGGVTNAAIDWAWYQGVGYLPPGNGTKVLGDLQQNSLARIFSFYDDQSSPVTNNLTFDWAVLPGISQTTLAAYATNATRPWVVVTNTPGLQAVAVPSENWLGAVFHTNAATLLASNLTVSVSRPTILLITTSSNQVATIYAADPYENMVAPYTNTVVPYTNSAQLVGQVVVTINGNAYPLTLPQWPYLGKTVSATISLSTTNVAPFIAGQPVDTNLSVGSTATFTVAAPAMPLPSYQWYENGTAILGATNPAFSKTAGLADTNASFICVITNSAGSVTSNPALLTVTDTPLISGIMDQILSKNLTTAPQPFTVSDSLVLAGALSVGVTSSNTTLIPNANLVLGGSGTNRTLTISPATNQTGYAMINLMVNNGTATASLAFMVTVASNNLPPLLLAITNHTVTGGASFSASCSASDQNVPALALGYALPTAPAGAVINALSGVISWRPPVGASGTSNQFLVAVTNTASLSATQVFYVSVMAPQKPALSAMGFINGHFKLTVNGSGGPDYTIQGATNLTAPVWLPLFTNLAASPPFQWTDTNPVPQQFYYRVLLGP